MIKSMQNQANELDFGIWIDGLYNLSKQMKTVIAKLS